MGHLLWKYYHHGDLINFRKLLSDSYDSIAYSLDENTLQSDDKRSTGGQTDLAISSNKVKLRKSLCQQRSGASLKGAQISLSYFDVNGRDYAGLTILHRAVSSTEKCRDENGFATALLNHPDIDLCVQDIENGWTALHRALYFGNITMARAIIERDEINVGKKTSSTTPVMSSSVFKIKDNEKNRPFDLYQTILPKPFPNNSRLTSPGFDDQGYAEDSSAHDAKPSDSEASEFDSVDGNLVFAWGSSRNCGLGFKDQDDRHYPEKITLRRPNNLLQRFYQEYQESLDDDESAKINQPVAQSISDIPFVIANRPIIIRDVVVSKLHSAIITADPESNLYMCGFGPGGRLGTGNEDTQFSFVSVHGGSLAGRRVLKIALGQDHSLAVIEDGSVLSWGSNVHSQLGYTLPSTRTQDHGLINVHARQILGPLRRVVVKGVAASTFHSAAYTSTSLFTWGRNKGQLGLMDSDSRSIKFQSAPREIAVSILKAPITNVCATDHATIVLLSNHHVYVFTNHGYRIVKFPLNHQHPKNYPNWNSNLSFQRRSNYVSSITAGNDTVGVISSRGELFTFTVREAPCNSSSGKSENPEKYDSLSQPERVWSPKKEDTSGIKSASISENGSILVCTRAGSVWYRMKRISTPRPEVNSASSKKECQGFERIPGLTNITAVRSTSFGVNMAIQKINDSIEERIYLDEPSLRTDTASLMVFHRLEGLARVQSQEIVSVPRKAESNLSGSVIDSLERLIHASSELEASLRQCLLRQPNERSFNIEVRTSSSDVCIPMHSFLLGRSSVLRRAMRQCRDHGEILIPNILYMRTKALTGGSELYSNVTTTLTFKGLEFMALVNLVVYLYTDTVIDTWRYSNQKTSESCRNQSILYQLINFAGHLELKKLQTSLFLRLMADEGMDTDMNLAIMDSTFFQDGDVIVELKDSERMVHSAILCRRCPFFQGLFNGHAAGMWLAGRRQGSATNPVRVDLKHISSRIFDFVIRFIYTDSRIELFDKVICANIEEFLNLVLEVMAIANELMLDSLSRVCQKVVARFVRDQNISSLINIIAPCSVHDFKVHALAYISRQLELMLENYLLSDLEGDLILQLDEIVRQHRRDVFLEVNRYERMFLLRYPDLTSDIKDERLRRIKDMEFRANLGLSSNRSDLLSTSHTLSAENIENVPLSRKKLKRKSKEMMNIPKSPESRQLRPESDLIFEMDTGDCSPLSRKSRSQIEAKMDSNLVTINHTATKVADPTWCHFGNIEPFNDASHQVISSKGLESQTESLASSIKTWSSAVPLPSKPDMREIMAQATSTKPKKIDHPSTVKEFEARLNMPKMSQKERRKQNHKCAAKCLPSSVDESLKIKSPWNISNRIIRGNSSDGLTTPQSKITRYAEQSESLKSYNSRKTCSIDSNSAGCFAKTTVHSTRSSFYASLPASYYGTIEGMSHSSVNSINEDRSRTLLLPSMSDIIEQQKREQEILRKSVTKRNLQEIQEEQAFQEWWDSESKRVQETEAARTATDDNRDQGKTLQGDGSRSKNNGKKKSHANYRGVKFKG